MSKDWKVLCHVVWHGVTRYDMVLLEPPERILHIVIKGRGEGRVKLHWRCWKCWGFWKCLNWRQTTPFLQTVAGGGSIIPGTKQPKKCIYEKILNVVMDVWTINHSEQSRWSCSIFNPTMQYLCWCSSCLTKIL